MIIRSLRLRHGRLALPKATPLRPYRRCISNAAPKQQQQDLSAQHLAPDQPPPATPEYPKGVRTDIRDPTHPVAQNYLLYHHNKQMTGDMGAVRSPDYKPHDLVADPPRPEDITLELLMASQSHIGHATSLWHPANAKYIFGVRGDQDPIHIISLDHTAAYLRRACKVVHGVAERGGLILFVGNRAGQARIVTKAAKLAKGCHLFSRWTPGTITNGQQILGLCRKKVVNERDEEILGFQDQLEYKSAIKPDLVVCLNPIENYILLHECGLHNVPTIGIIDTDANPTWVTYPIPANDDSVRSVSVIAGALGRAGEAGQKARLEAAARKQINYFPTHGLNPPIAGQAQKERETLEREAQEEKAYIDEGEVVEESLNEMERAQAAAALESADAEDGLMEDVLDADIEGAGEGGAYAYQNEPEARNYSFEDKTAGDVYVDSSLVEGEQVDRSDRLEGVGGRPETDADAGYSIDRTLNSEEMRQGEEFGLEDDVADEMDREQFGGMPEDEVGNGRRDR